MQVLYRVVGWVAVDVVDDVSAFSPRNLSMLPFAPGALRSISKSARDVSFGMVSIMLRYGCVGWCRSRCVCYWTDHDVASMPKVRAVFHAAFFLLVGVCWITVTVPHLVVPPAHFTGNGLALAVSARPPDCPPSPLVIWGSMLLHSLVVHEAKSIRGMFAAASFNAAFFVELVCWHASTFPDLLACRVDGNAPGKYKALGNGFAVPVVSWIAGRINSALQDQI